MRKMRRNPLTEPGAERRPGSDPPESHAAAGDVDRNGDLRIVAYVADRRATDQPGSADVEGLSYLQIDRVRLILRPGVAKHYEDADNDHCDARHNRSCPHVPPRLDRICFQSTARARGGATVSQWMGETPSCRLSV